ncbi:class I SAM-dependent methyltransferase [Synechococcus sp. CS-1324]|nr:class I SAM-dependent methyltransferase [Synechococcus sp. CS-1324]
MSHSPVIVVSSVVILQCHNCHFIFPEEIPSADQLRFTYDHGYSDKRIIQGQRVNAFTNARILKKLIGDLGGKKILDVGSGYGFLPSLLSSEHNIKCDGLEISSAQRDHSSNVLNINTFSDLGNVSYSYDIICAFEVIEHISSPLHFIEDLTRLLVPGGHLVLATDNFQSKTVLEMGSSFPKWIPDEHISCFSPSSLNFLLGHMSCLFNTKIYTYEPWEMLAFRLAHRIKCLFGMITTPLLSSHSLQASPQSNTYRFYQLRKLLNPIWSPRALSGSGLGEMIVAHSRKMY